MPDINIWAVLLAAVLSFALGGLWYSPILFGKTWMRETGVTEAKGHPAKVFGISFLFAFVAAYGLAFLLGPQPEMHAAIHDALLVGIAFIFSSYAINYQFAQRSFKLLAIDGGYHIVQFVLYAVVLALWH